MKNGIHRIFIEKGASVIASKHVLFDENVYPLMKNSQHVTVGGISGSYRAAHKDVVQHDDDTRSTADTFPTAMNDEWDDDKSSLVLENGNTVTSDEYLEAILFNDTINVQTRRY